MTSDGVTSLTDLLPAEPILKEIQNNRLKYTQNGHQIKKKKKKKK